MTLAEKLDLYEALSEAHSTRTSPDCFDFGSMEWELQNQFSDFVLELRLTSDPMPLQQNENLEFEVVDELVEQNAGQNMEVGTAGPTHPETFFEEDSDLDEPKNKVAKLEHEPRDTAEQGASGVGQDNKHEPRDTETGKKGASKRQVRTSRARRNKKKH